MSKRNKYIFSMLLVVGISWMIADSFLQPGIKDLDGDFKELAFIRNEQNTGPVVRIYAVSVKDTVWGAMEAYGNYMPHTKYGVTRVYFSLNNNPLPGKADLSIEGDNLDEKYKSFCIGRYEKNIMSKALLTRYPFNSQ
jgi:hypothetical protein